MESGFRFAFESIFSYCNSITFVTFTLVCVLLPWVIGEQLFRLSRSGHSYGVFVMVINILGIAATTISVLMTICMLTGGHTFGFLGRDCDLFGIPLCQMASAAFYLFGYLVAKKGLSWHQ